LGIFKAFSNYTKLDKNNQNSPPQEGACRIFDYLNIFLYTQHLKSITEEIKVGNDRGGGNTYGMYGLTPFMLGGEWG
jgi:hypothetical protein